MKILTKAEEEAHYHETVKGGISGGLLGLTLVGLYRLLPDNKWGQMDWQSKCKSYKDDTESAIRITSNTPP
jgi:hypothetical protein